MRRVGGSVVWGAVVLIAAPLLSLPAGAAEGVESPLDALVAAPVPPLKAPVKPLKKIRRAFSRRVARIVHPLLDYPRRHLTKLLPCPHYLPPSLKKREHDDYLIPGVTLMPRWWTTFDWGRPSLLAGNQDHVYEDTDSPKPIGERGSFQLSTYPDLPPPLCWLPLYFAFTTPGGVHFRLGARWDDIDAYTVVPSVAVKFKVE